MFFGCLRMFPLPIAAGQGCCFFSQRCYADFDSLFRSTDFFVLVNLSARRARPNLRRDKLPE